MLYIPEQAEKEDGQVWAEELAGYAWELKDLKAAHPRWF